VAAEATIILGVWVGRFVGAEDSIKKKKKKKLNYIKK
jgi:hypothetical protein